MFISFDLPTLCAIVCVVLMIIIEHLKKKK